MDKQGDVDAVPTGDTDDGEEGWMNVCLRGSITDSNSLPSAVDGVVDKDSAVAFSAEGAFQRGVRK